MDKIEEVRHQRDLLATALLNVLRKAGMLNNDTEPNGAELIMFSEQFCQLFESKDEGGLAVSGIITDSLLKEIVELANQEKTGYLRIEKAALEGLMRGINKTAEIKDAEFEKKCKDCEYDPQAAQFGWFIEQGWLTPEEAKMKDAEIEREYSIGKSDGKAKGYLIGYKAGREYSQARIEALIGQGKYYPSHLKDWAHQIQNDLRYESQLVTYLLELAGGWEATHCKGGEG